MLFKALPITWQSVRNTLQSRSCTRTAPFFCGLKFFMALQNWKLAGPLRSSPVGAVIQI
jgi:hypothetical protein